MGRRMLLIGAVLLLMGAQLRFVDSYVLTPKASHFVESQLHSSSSSGAYDQSLLYSVGPYPTEAKTFTPPRWMGWACLSAGAVMVLHGLTISRLD